MKIPLALIQTPAATVTAANMHPRFLRVLREGNTTRLRSEIRKYLEVDPNVSILTEKGNNLLHIAAGLGYSRAVTEICDLSPSLHLLTTPNACGDTPLHRAARAGEDRIAVFLIRRARSAGQHAVLGAQNDAGNTALHEAVKGRCTAAARELMDAHPQLGTMVNENSESALYLAAEKGSLEIVKMLLEHGHCNYLGPSRQTALHAAVCRSYDIARLLLEDRVELSWQPDASGSIPLHYAVSMGDEKMVQLLRKYDYTAAHVSDKDGIPPIHIAASMGHIGVIEEILEQCPDASELTDKDGKNLLHVAIEKKRLKVVKYVLENYADPDLVNGVDHKGNTPLHLATVHHNLEIIRLLLADNRVETSPRNQNGLTPLDLASSCVEPGIRLRMNKIMVELVTAGSLFSPQRMDLESNKIHRNQVEEINRCRALANNLAIVAVLIATVTFAAAFTLPGGYKSDDRQDQGMAVLAKKVAFKAFLVSDVVAMMSSIMVTCLLIYTGSRDHDVRLHSISTAMNIMWLALGGMVVAFATGTYVVIESECRWLAILVCFVACCGPFAAWVVSCWPTLDCLKLVKGGRKKAKGKYDVLKAVSSHMPFEMIVDFETPAGSKSETVILNNIE